MEPTTTPVPAAAPTQRVEPAQPITRNERPTTAIVPMPNAEPAQLLTRNEYPALMPMQKMEPVQQQLLRSEHSSLVEPIYMQQMTRSNENSSLISLQKVEPMQHPMTSECHLFSSSDDNAMMRQIQATHSPDGREVDVKTLLNIIENMLLRSAQSVIGGLQATTTQANMDALEDKTHQEGFIGMIEALAYTIHNISCEVPVNA